MADLPRFDEFFNLYVREALAAQSGLTEQAFRTPGTDANATAAAAATVSEEVTRQVAILARDLSWSSKGAALDRFIYDRVVDPTTGVGMLRQDATPAVATLVWTRPAPGPAGTLPAGFKVAAGAVEFALVDSVVFSAAQTSATITATAGAAGAAGNVLAFSLTSPQGSLFDTTLTVTNPERAAGGQEREDDESFKGRAARAWQALRRGTLGAIEFGALQVPGVGMARAFTIDIPSDSGQVLGRWIRLAVADRAGNSNTAMAASVAAQMDEWAAGGDHVEVVAGAAIDVYVVLRCAFLAGVNTLQAAARIRRTIANYINGLGMCGLLQVGVVADLVRRDPAVVRDSVSVSVPAGDVQATQWQVLRSAPDLVSINPA